MESFTVKASAKINLNLHITGRREDGYHLLSSLFVFTQLGDELRFYPTAAEEGFTLEIKGEFADGLAPSADEKNSVVRAAKVLAERLGRKPWGKVVLYKNLPVAAGIGGGTADAAAALVGLLRLWQEKENMAEAELMKIAVGLGADVPASLKSCGFPYGGVMGAPVLVAGIGERLALPPRLPENLALVLVNPRALVPTAEIFALRAKGVGKGQGQDFSAPFCYKAQYESAEELASDLKQGTRNDLAAPARQICPVISEVLAELEGTAGCLFAQMSGSGATCFGLYKGQKEAGTAASRILARHKDWWVKDTKIIV